MFQSGNMTTYNNIFIDEETMSHSVMSELLLKVYDRDIAFSIQPSVESALELTTFYLYDFILLHACVQGVL